jgi:hypothetical protein
VESVQPIQVDDVVRRVGPGQEEALASLLQRLSRLRDRLRMGRKKKTPPDEKDSSPTKKREN